MQLAIKQASVIRTVVYLSDFLWRGQWLEAPQFWDKKYAIAVKNMAIFIQLFNVNDQPFSMLHKGSVI